MHECTFHGVPWEIAVASFACHFPLLPSTNVPCRLVGWLGHRAHHPSQATEADGAVSVHACAQVSRLLAPLHFCYSPVTTMLGGWVFCICLSLTFATLTPTNTNNRTSSIILRPPRARSGIFEPAFHCPNPAVISQHYPTLINACHQSLRFAGGTLALRMHCVHATPQGLDFSMRDRGLAFLASVRQVSRSKARFAGKGTPNEVSPCICF